jgi:hypothetical protein
LPLFFAVTYASTSVASAFGALFAAACAAITLSPRLAAAACTSVSAVHVASAFIALSAAASAAIMLSTRLAAGAAGACTSVSAVRASAVAGIYASTSAASKAIMLWCLGCSD